MHERHRNISRQRKPSGSNGSGEIRPVELFAPYLMNRADGAATNADLRKEKTNLGLTTPKMRTLAVLSVIDTLTISELASIAVVEQSTLSRSLERLTSDGLVRRGARRQ